MNLTFPYTQNNNNVWLTNTGMPLREHFQLENSMEQTPIQFSTSVGPKKKKSWFFLCKSVNRREIWLLSSFSDRRIKLDPAHLLFKDDRRIGGGGARNDVMVMILGCPGLEVRKWGPPQQFM